MKIIFLDFDGVLNHSETVRMAPDWAIQRHPYNWVETHLVKRLGNLVEKTGAKIVVSSTWRREWDVPELEKILSDEDPRLAGAVIGKTPNFGDWGSIRGEEIAYWLDTKASDTPYVVFDDNPWCLQHGERFIQTNEITGLTDKNVRKAIDLLHK